MSSPQLRLLHVFSGDVISMHNTAARGHFRTNVERDARACFEVDEPVPKSFYPRLSQVTVYELAVERISGKHCPLPPVSEQWPALDSTRTPNAKAPG